MQEVVAYLRPDPVPALPMLDGKSFLFWGAKQAKSGCKLSLADASKTLASLRDMYCDPEGVDGDPEHADDGEDGAVDAPEGDGEEPKSELDKLIEEAAEEDLSLGIGGEEAADGDTICLLEDLSGLAGEGNLDPEGPVSGAPASSSGVPSSAAVEVPPVPPPPEPVLPPPEPAAKKLRVQVGALACCEVTGGSISFYAKGVFEAVCKNKLHGNCVASRSVSKIIDAKLGRPKGGRPLGVLLAWLAKHDCSTKSEHWSIENFTAPYAERVLFRLGLQDTADGQELLKHERDHTAGEDIEPSDADVWEYFPKGSCIK
jgi:hypothetical protein